MLWSYRKLVYDWATAIQTRVKGVPWARPFVRLSLIVGALWGGSALGAPAHTQSAETTPGAAQSEQKKRQSAPSTLEQAVDKVREQTPGRVLSAEIVQRDGQTVYRIKILTPDGRVMIIEVDAGGQERPK
jgi:hypothetical protein